MDKITINYKGQDIEIEQLPNGKFKKPDIMKEAEGKYAGAQLKPAIEVVIVVQKKMDKTNYTEQFLSNRKGCLNLNDCRIPYKDSEEGGRFPANLLISDDVLDDYSRFYSLDAWAERNLPFLIVPKAAKKEKNLGLDKNDHPTVKPIKLMSYLITMGSRSGDTILDPFAGSGTTGCAAITLGRKYILIEKDPEYIKIIKARLKYWSSLPLTF